MAGSMARTFSALSPACIPAKSAWESIFEMRRGKPIELWMPSSVS